MAADPHIKRRQQLHADIDIPSQLFLALYNLVILYTDNVLNPFQGFHQLDFSHKVIHNSL